MIPQENIKGPSLHLISRLYFSVIKRKFGRTPENDDKSKAIQESNYNVERYQFSRLIASEYKNFKKMKYGVELLFLNILYNFRRVEASNSNLTDTESIRAPQESEEIHRYQTEQLKSLFDECSPDESGEIDMNKIRNILSHKEYSDYFIEVNKNKIYYM